MRIFEGEENKRWARSVSDLKLSILCVSQFTLYHTLKGNKPDFREAMATEDSKILYEKFISKLQDNYEPNLVKSIIRPLQDKCLKSTFTIFIFLDGIFGAYMQVHIQNDGPVTLEILSPSSKHEV